MNVDKLSMRAEEDASRRSIKDLVQSTTVGEKVLPVVRFFGLSSEATSMISSLAQLKDSILLRQYWIENGNKALTRIAQKEQQKNFLSVEDVMEFVWTPSIEQLQSLKHRFLTGVISFGEVDRLLKLFDRKYEDLAKEIRIITSRNGDQVHPLGEIINQRIEKIQQYYKLHSCIKAAGIILNFKAALGLEGDFQVVEDLHNQVSLDLEEICAIHCLTIL